jgi:hypothetical protein
VTPEADPEREALGGSFASTEVVAVSDAPFVSVTVTVMVYDPPEEYVCDAVLPAALDVLPSPQS